MEFNGFLAGRDLIGTCMCVSAWLQSVHLLLGHDLQRACPFYKHLLVDTALVIMF